MKSKLIQSELVGDWLIDLWNDGKMDVWTFTATINNSFAHFKLTPNMSFGDNCMVPEYVRREVYRVRDLHRDTQRLALTYRIESHSCKRKVYISKGFKGFSWW